ncbi:MAG TPA: hypothetical protein VGG74_11225 [Kofleriaceae bacterium]|jgi:hypothetical protein
MKLFLVVLIVVVVAGCASNITETRVTFAPARPANCELELVRVDITAIDFNRRWDLLGYVSLTNNGVLDPASPTNRELVRPRACTMGGTAVAVAMNSTSQNVFGARGSGLVYMVLRPKTWAQQPTRF